MRYCDIDQASIDAARDRLRSGRMRKTAAEPYPVLEGDARTAALRVIKAREGLPRLYTKEDGTQAYEQSGLPSEGVTYSIPVYDDADPSNNWLPGGSRTYEEFQSSLKGYPTVGYGMRYDLLPEEDRKYYLESNGLLPQTWLDEKLGQRMDATIGPALARHPHIKNWNIAQQANIADFFYNMGASPRNKETMEAAISANDEEAIHRALPLYNKVNGKANKGVSNRRSREMSAFAPWLDVPAQQQQTSVQPARPAVQPVQPAQAQVPVQPPQQQPVKR